MAGGLCLSVYLLEDLGRFSWWPYRLEGMRLDSLWLVEDAEQGSAVRLLRRVLADCSWFAMGTWLGKEADQLRGLADRYPGFQKSRIAASRAEDPRGWISQTEWAQVDGESEFLEVFLEVLRRSRGKGGCVSVAPDRREVRDFYAVTAGLVWRVASGALSGEVYDVVNGSVSRAQLNLLPQLGFLPVVPLDKHPLSGVALLGLKGQISSVALKLGSLLEVQSSVREIEQLFSAAGGLAL